MSFTRIAGFGVILLLCIFSSACFTFEQEIFLNPDGSGEMTLYIALPDFPEDLKSESAPGQKKDPAFEMAQFKKEMTSSASPSIKIKEVREIKANGSQGIYAVFQFKDIKDMQATLANLGKGSLKDGEITGNSQWTVELKKEASKRSFTGRFLLDIDDKKEAKKPEDKPEEKKEGEPKIELNLDGFGEQMKSLLLGTIRFRFVLHAPSPITDTNADMVIRDNIAVWNCSLIAFVKNKKPIEMKASY